MLKTEMKQNIVLLVFSMMMYEVLTVPTLIFVVLGILSVTLGLKTNKLVRNILALGIFASYWITYGKLIDPEIGLNFLTSIIVLKILERESERDHYMIFFGLVLLLSAGALFEKTLTYASFFVICFFVLIKDFYSFLGLRFKLKDLGLALLWVAPLTFLLFFLVPRLMNPLPFNQNTLTPGEIGYTPDVNISDIESLIANNSPVFQVALNQKLKQHDLYWRGNTLSFSDGWNWRLMPFDKTEADFRFEAPPENYIKQNIRLFTTPDFFFGLDLPAHFSYGNQFYTVKNDRRTLPQMRWKWVQRYSVLSEKVDNIAREEDIRKYLQNPLSKNEKEMINKTFHGQSVSELEASIRDYLLKNQFSYSLSPGKTSKLFDFLENKKGFCSHYASAVALILRTKGVAARLVSGYMGGSYNSFGDFYLINQNDAHVWVEALVDGKWNRLDPTEWIAPTRVELGGEAFIESVTAEQTARFRYTHFFGFINVMRQWIQQWDYYFYRWLEEMDYYGQEAWLDRLHLKREWLYSLIPAILLIFMLIYLWFLSKERKRSEENEIAELWTLFYKRMKKKGHELSLVSVNASGEFIRTLSDEKLASLWRDLISVSFEGQNKSVRELKKRIKKI